MQTYYHARVTSKLLDDCSITLYTVKLLTANEDGYQTVATIEDIQDGKSAHDLAAFWQTGGHNMLQTIFQGQLRITRNTYPDTVWVQGQAPAGNWYDSLGCNGPDSLAEARRLAPKLLGKGKPYRIVRKIIEVIDEEA